MLGGLGEYFEVDPALLRLTWLLVVIFTGFIPGILAYILAVFVIPPRKHRINEDGAETGQTHSKR